jgi:ABC-2 type transport system permease protein
VSDLSTLVIAHFRNSYRLRGAVCVMLGLSLLLVATVVALVLVLAILPETGSPTPDAAKAARYVGLIAYGSGLLVMGMNLNVFTANNLVREKTQHLFDSVLACPVEIRTLWMARSLAVFLPGLVLCEALAAASLVAVDAFVVAPHMELLVSPMIILNGLAVVPALYFPLCCLVLLVALTANPVAGNVIANVAYSAVITLVINLVLRAGLDVGSFVFTLAHLALAGGLALVVLLLQPRLTKERVVLSSRT